MPELETCATHGLRYDPALANGCVLCRRIAEPEREPPRQAPWGTIGVLLTMGALITAAAMCVRAPPAIERVERAETARGTHREEAPAETVSRRIDGPAPAKREKPQRSESTQSKGEQPQAIDYEALVNSMNPGGAWQAAAPRILPVPQLADEVRRDMTKPVVIVICDFGHDWCQMFLRDLTPSIRAHRHQARFLVYSIAASYEAFIVGTKPFASVFDPVWVQSPDGDKPYFGEQLGQLKLSWNKKLPFFGVLKPDGRVLAQDTGYYPIKQLIKVIDAALGCSGVHGADDQKLAAPASPEEASAVLAAVKAADESVGTNAPEFVAKLRPALPLFKVAQLSYQQNPKPYVLNSHGAGIDGIRFALPPAHSGGISFVVATPPNVSWSLVPHQLTDGYWPAKSIDVDAARWPHSYRAEIQTLFKEQLKLTNEYTVVFRFPDRKPVDIYFTYTTYVYGANNIDQQEMLGLSRKPDATLESALWRGNIELVKSIVASGVDINSKPALAYALVGMWPLGKLDQLLELGVEINTPYQSTPPLRAAVDRLFRSSTCEQDQPVADAVKRLIAAKADLHARSGKKNQTALELARERGCPLTLAVLQQARP